MTEISIPEAVRPHFVHLANADGRNVDALLQAIAKQLHYQSNRKFVAAVV
jgi:hypothetical protein